jgi:hypothetical protein
MSHFNMISLGLEISADGPSRTGFRPVSIWKALRELALSWFRHHGLLLVALETRSCYHRILLGRKKRWDTCGLVIEELRASMPEMIFPRNCSETLSYSLSIQALERERPYLTPADYELFGQAWFQAAKWFARRSDMGCGRRAQESSITANGNNETLCARDTEIPVRTVLLQPEHDTPQRHASPLVSENSGTSAAHRSADCTESCTR